MSESWPPELDAMIAAPEHHELLFENDRVRVLRTHIPPGEKTAVHTHPWPGVLNIVQWSDLVRTDADNNVLMDSRNNPSKPTDGSVNWTEPLGPHAAENVGDRELIVIAVEIKK
jgi:hypothetical protein